MLAMIAQGCLRGLSGALASLRHHVTHMACDANWMARRFIAWIWFQMQGRRSGAFAKLKCPASSCAVHHINAD